MKSKIVIIICFFSIKFCYSQQGLVNYGFIESLTIGNSIGDDLNAVLKFDKNNSEYVTGQIALENPEILGQEKVYINPDGGGFISSGLVVTKNGNQVIINRKEHLMLSNIKHGKQIYLKELLPEINWNILSEKKQIGNFTCTKATTSFRGRNYIAWFTNEIPLPYGPWKLQGLPGLILEAYNENKNLYWYFKSIQYPKNDIVIATDLKDENLNIQTQYLDINGYSAKLLEIFEKTYEKNLIFGVQNGVEVQTVNYNKLFFEKF